MPVADWTKAEDWDVLFLGGKRMPGIAKVTLSLPSGLDVQKPKGGKAARISDDGTPPAELSIELTLQPHEMEAFRAVHPILRPRAKSGAREPIEIAHPQAALWGVNVVTVGPIESEPPESGGVYTCSFTAYEWVPAPVKVKPKKNPKPKDAQLADSNAVLQENRAALKRSAPANFSSRS